MNTKIRVVLIGLFMALFCAGSAFAGFKADSLEATNDLVTRSLKVSSMAANGYFMKSDAAGLTSWSDLFGGANVWTGVNSFDNILSLRAQVIASTDTTSVSSVKLMGGYSEDTGARLMLTGDGWTGTEKGGSADLSIKDTSSQFQITERAGSTVPLKVAGNGNTEILGTLKIAGIEDVKARFDAIATSTGDVVRLGANNYFSGANAFTSNRGTLDLWGGNEFNTGAEVLINGDEAGSNGGGVEIKIKDASSFTVTNRAGGTPFTVATTGNTEILGTLKIAGTDDVEARLDAIAISTAAAGKLTEGNIWTSTNTFNGLIVASTVTVSGVMNLTDTNSKFYFGSAGVANSWRIAKGDGNSLVFEYTTDGTTWVEKSRMIP
jgi:hypothetical protein